MNLFKHFATLALAIGTVMPSLAETVVINGKDYEIATLAQRQIGPGTVWKRLRIPGYPLNVNLVTVDVSNPYARIETMQGAETVGKTESIVAAATRVSAPGHNVLAGANGNFWCVANQAPWSDLLIGTAFGGSVKNGKIITETNAAADQWCGGPQQTCVIATDDSRLYIEPMLWQGSVASEKTGTLPVTQVNKVVRPGEIGLYNAFYPSTKAFQPVTQTDGHYVITPGVSTEVLLALLPGSEWAIGAPMQAVVKEVRVDDGRGALGDADMALVANQGAGRDALAKLSTGDVVTFANGWTSYANGVTPRITNLLQGLSLVMKDGVQDYGANQGNSYNNMVYPKTGYGCSADKKTLYIITIDKATDPVYGSSAGCPSNVMCDILAHFGCADAATVDAGGSTEMLINRQVVNRTTEGNPRAIANGWFVVSVAPEDNEVASIQFNDVTLRVPVLAPVSPQILAYNKYGDLIDENLEGVSFSCAADAGTCSGSIFTAGATPGTASLTATYGAAKVTKDVEIVAAQPKLRLNPILIDNRRQYPVEVTATVDGRAYDYNPADMVWNIDDPNLASISDDGVLKGQAEGSTKIRLSLGEFSDEADLRVEIPKANAMDMEVVGADAAGWKTAVTSTKVNSLAGTADGKGLDINFNITNTRGPKVTVSKDVVLYSLPDGFDLTVNPGTTAGVSEITLSLQPANAAKPVAVKRAVNGTDVQSFRFEASEFGDNNDMAFYPLTFKSIALSLSGKTGTHTVSVPNMQALYDVSDSVDDISTSQYVNDSASDAVYNLHGVRMDENNLVPGIYIRHKNGTTKKIIVK